jgi:hypothetical protein
MFADQQEIPAEQVHVVAPDQRTSGDKGIFADQHENIYRGPLPAEQGPAAPDQRTSGDEEIFADQQEVLLVQQNREQLLQINEHQVIRGCSLIK